MMLTLNACTKDQYSYDTKESTKALMPTIVQYEQKTLDSAITEVSGGACPIHVEFAKDYIQIRDRLRLIESELD